MRALCVLHAISAVVLFAGVASAQATWTGAASNNWDNPFNWSTGSVPGAATDVIIAPAANQPSTYIFAPVCDDLTINVGATMTLSAGFDLTVNGALTINGTLNVGSSSSDITLTGNWTNNGAYTHGGATVEMVGNGTLGGSATSTFQDLVVANLTRTAQASFTVQGDMSVESAGDLVLNGGVTASVAGNWASSGAGVTTTGAGFVQLTGTGSLTTGLNGLPNLRVSGGTRTVNASTVTGTLELTGGTLVIGDNATLVVGGNANLSAGTLSFDSGFAGAEILDINGNATVTAADGTFSSEARILCAGNWSSSSVFSPGAGSVELDVAGTNTISGASPTFFNLRIVAGTTNVLSACTVTGSLVVDTGAILDADAVIDANGDVAIGGASATWNMGGLTHTVAGNWNAAGGSATNGTIKFDGPGNINTGGGSIDRVEAGAGLRTVAALVVTTDLSVTAGELRINDGATLAVGADVNLTGGTFSFNDTTGALEILDLAGDFIATGAVVGTWGATSQVRCAGDWNAAPGFAATAGEIWLDGGTVASVLGTPSLPSLRIVSGTKTITAGANLSGNLRLDDGAALITNGSLDIEGAVTLGIATATWNMGGLAHTVGTNWSSSGGSATNGTIHMDGAGGTLSTGTGSIANLTIGAGSFTASTSTVMGNLVVNGGTLTIGTGATLTVNEDADFNGGAVGLAAGADLNVADDIDVSGAAAGAMSPDSTIHFAGDWTGSASWNPPNGTAVYDGGGGGSILGTDARFANLTIQSGSVTASGPMTIDNNLILTGSLTSSGVTTVNGPVALAASAAWNLGGLTHKVEGNWTSGGASATNGTIEFFGDGTTTFGSGTIANVSVTGGIRTCMTGTIPGTLTVAGGTLRVTDNQSLTVNGNASFTSGFIGWFPAATGAPEVLTVQGDVVCNVDAEFESANSQFICKGNWSSNSIFTPAAATVRLDGTSPTTVTGTPSFFNLTVATNTRTFNGPTTVNGLLTIEGPGVVDANAAFDINGSVDLGTSGTFDAGSFVHKVGGDWTTAGGSVIGTGAIEFDGTGTVNTGLTGSIQNVLVSGGTRSAQTSIFGNLAMTGGTLRILNDQIVTVTGNAALTGGTLAFEDTSGGSGLETLDVDGDINITCAAGTMNNSSVILVAGNWTSTSAWSPTAGGVFFDGGTTKSIGGTNPTFNNLVIFSGSKTTNGPVLVHADLTVFDGETLTSTAAIEVEDDVLLLPGATWNAGALTHVIHGDWTSTGATVSNSGTLRFVDDGTLATGTSTVPNVVVASGTRRVETSRIRFTLSMTGGELLIEDNQTLTVVTNATLSGGTLSFEDLTPGDETLLVQGDASVSAASGTTSASSRIEVLGDWTSTSAWSPLDGTVAMAPPPQLGTVTLGGTNPTFARLEIASGSVNALVAATASALAVESGALLTTQAALDVNGSVTLGDSTAAWDIGASTHKVAGDWTSAGASATGAGKIELDGPGTCNTGGGSLPSLLISGGPRSFSSATIAGSLEMIAGTMAIQDNAAVSVSGDATLSGGTLSFLAGTPGPEILDVDGDVTIAGAIAGGSSPEGQFLCGGDWSSGASYTPGGGTVILDGGGAGTIGGAGLTLAGLQVAAGSKTLASAATLTSLGVASGASLVLNGVVDVNGAVTLGDATSTLNLGGLTHTVQGDWTSAGCNGTNGTVRFDGNGTLNSGAASVANVEVTAGTRIAQTSLIAGNLLMTGGALRIADDQTLQVQGGAGLLAGTLTWSAVAAGLDEVLDVDGDVLCTATAGNTSSGSHLRCGGDWTSNGAFNMASGTVTLDGAAPSTIAAAAPNFDPKFSRLVIRNGTRTVASDMTMTVALMTIEATGALDVADKTLAIPGNPMTVDGELSIGTDGTLALGPTSVVLVTSSGRMNVVGAFGQPAIVTGTSGGGYLMNIDGELDAVNFRFEKMSPTGITITEDATLINLLGGVFSTPSAALGSLLLDISRPSPTTLSYIDFEDPLGVGTSNVRALGGASITFVESEGNFSGPAFEFDPLGLLEWVNDPTTISSYTAKGGPDVVTVTWTTTNETDTATWVLQRGSSASGPFSDLSTLPAAGPSTYMVSDVTVTPGQTYWYKLLEFKSFGLIDDFGTKKATPWTTGLPPNVLTVGPSGAFPTIQAAISAATFLGAVISVEPGSYGPFTVTGPTVGTLRIYGNGPGVVIDTTTGPVTIQNLGATNSVEISDFTIGSAGSPNPGVVVQNCLGPVVLDELTIVGGTGQPGIRITSSTKTAVQRCITSGTPGVRAELGSIAVVGRGSLDDITLTGGSNVRLAQVAPVPTVEAGSTLTTLPGTHADLSAPEFVQLGVPFQLTLDGPVGSPYVIAFSTSIAWFDLPNPPWEMVGLINILAAPTVASGVLAAPPTVLNLPLPADGVLFGAALPLQMVVVTLAPTKFRWSNVSSIVLGN